jgi:hypothetical protein
MHGTMHLGMRGYYRTGRRSGASVGPLGMLVIGIGYLFYLGVMAAFAVLAALVLGIVAIIRGFAPGLSERTLRKVVIGAVVGAAMIASVVAGTAGGSRATEQPAQSTRGASSAGQGLPSSPAVQLASMRGGSASAVQGALDSLSTACMETQTALANSLADLAKHGHRMTPVRFIRAVRRGVKPNAYTDCAETMAVLLVRMDK